MNNEQSRRQSELDSRRVSTGVICRVIREVIKPTPKGIKDPHPKDATLTGLLGLLKKHGYFPDTLKGFPPQDGIDSASGIAFVVPRNMLDFFEEELKIMRTAIEDLKEDEETLLMEEDLPPIFMDIDPKTRHLTEQQKATDPRKRNKRTREQIADIKIKQKRVEQKLLHNLADNIFMATIDPKTAAGENPSGQMYDIFINTREQQESAAVLIRRDIGPKEPKKWTEDVRAQEKVNQYWRERQRARASAAETVRNAIIERKEDEKRIDNNGQETN